MDTGNVRVKKEEKTEEGKVGDDNDTNPLNVPDKDGDFPLLIAVRDGASSDCIRKLLNDGANVNIKSENEVEDNAAHKVMYSLMEKASRTFEEATGILNLLVANGFSFINEKNGNGRTPLHLAMDIHDLSEDILTWFLRNGADFNASEPENGDTVLAKAIKERQRGAIIRRIYYLGGNVMYVDKLRRSALHISAACAHESAMEFFLDNNMFLLDVNEEDAEKDTPLHLLFSHAELDYQHCLRMLLRKGANFCAKNNAGIVPMVRWLKCGEGNPFPTFMKVKDKLSSLFTQEIASAVLTVMVEMIETFRAFLPCSSCQSPSEAAEFIAFLIEEKKAKLGLKDEEDKWKVEHWEFLKFFSHMYCENEVETTERRNEKDKLISVYATVLGKIDFRTTRRTFQIPIENVIICLLAFEEYQAFVDLCSVLVKFCFLRAQ